MAGGAACSRSEEPPKRTVITLPVPTPPPGVGATTAPPTATSTTEPSGIVVHTASGSVTLEGTDRDPTVSPQGDRIAYVHGDDLMIESALSEEKSTLVKHSPSGDPRANLTGLRSPRFSPKGDHVYFLADAWGNTGGVHVVDVAAQSSRFLVDGLQIDVVAKGAQAGDLVVRRQMVYGDGSPPVEEFWLVTPEGKPLRSLARADDLRAASILRNIVDGGPLPDAG